MSYVDGFVLPVPKKNLPAYRRMAAKAGKIWREHGAIAKPGLLVSLRAVRIHAARIDELPDALAVDAEKLLDNGSSWQYQFRVLHRDMLLAEGRAAGLRPTEDR